MPRERTGDALKTPSAKTVARIVALALLLAAAVLAVRALPVKEQMDAFLHRVQESGPAGVVVFVAGYAIAALLLPASILTLGAGAVFGVPLGFAAVSVASTTTACLAFLIARYFARGWVESKISSFPKFGAIDRAVAGNGFRIVLLTRLSPVFPFTWQNYLYGVTRVRFRDYALASWIGMLPGTFAFVYVGYAGRLAAEATAGRSGDGQILEWTLNGLGILATIVVTVYVTRVARAALAEAVPADGAPTATRT